MRLTRDAAQAAEILNIDHVIIGDGRVVSLKEQGGDVNERGANPQ